MRGGRHATAAPRPSAPAPSRRRRSGASRPRGCAPPRRHGTVATARAANGHRCGLPRSASVLCAAESANDLADSPAHRGPSPSNGRQCARRAPPPRLPSPCSSRSPRACRHDARCSGSRERARLPLGRGVRAAAGGSGWRRPRDARVAARQDFTTAVARPSRAAAAAADSSRTSSRTLKSRVVVARATNPGRFGSRIWKAVVRLMPEARRRRGRDLCLAGNLCRSARRPFACESGFWGWSCTFISASLKERATTDADC